MTTNLKAKSPGQFDFGLTDAQEKHARILHGDSIVIDLLSQHAGGSNIFNSYPEELQIEFNNKMRSAVGFNGLTDAEMWPYEMARDGKSNLIRDWYLSSGLTCGTYGIGVHDGNDPLSIKLDLVNKIFDELPWLRRVTTAEEIRKAKRDGLLALYAHWQPLAPAPRDLGALDAAYAKGLRSFMLTYNLMDNIGVGCTERVDAGLSMFGINVVKHCNDIGMIVDVSHCGHLTTMDACRFSTKPVNANHTAACGLHPHARGKSDDALRAIAATNGVIGVVTVPPFLTADASPTINHMLDHIDYISELVGARHVAIGTDWPMQVPLNVLEATLGLETKSIGFREQDRLDLSARLAGYEDCRDLRNITRGLVKRGYSDEHVRGILGENALRVFAAVCG